MIHDINNTVAKDKSRETKTTFHGSYHYSKLCWKALLFSDDTSSP
jgi:hypothetical protein